MLRFPQLQTPAVTVARLLSSATTRTVSRPLQQFDPELYNLVSREKLRQSKTIALIASENYIPRYCSEALASCLSSRYSEGTPGHRYYAGNEIIDQVERLCQKRALEAFRLRDSEWGVNVQAYSGSPANFAVFNGILKPGDKILFLDLPHGGHLSHGFHNDTKRVTATSKYFNCLPYRLNATTQRIDYDEVKLLADRFRPQIIIAGCSSYPRLLDYKRFREIADQCGGALVMSDVAHISGLMAGDVIPSAFEYSDIVTTTTHKTLRGPRGSLIFFRKDRKCPHNGEPLESAINSSVFPACQGGPHNHTIGAIAVALKATVEPEFKEYQHQILKNAQALAKNLSKHNFELVTGGTENHLLLLDLTNKKLKGKRVEQALELCNIVCNKNAVLSDKSSSNPSGIRLGTPAMTTRGMTEKDFEVVGDTIAEIVNIAQIVQRASCKISAEEWIRKLQEIDEIKQIKNKMENFATSFPAIESGIWN
eukprot:Gregarina_sp_Poly_1__8200@NODE_475_length_8096_cov_496_560966_g384_i0_p2_GENE_NODE_475_length_8096_cov_496_560966_g384_i0NODE_475_length_8096_cov_496_560966_g384_i0_p2_ORF_typecomplete_len480_score53_09SHMT/PF00464_19/7e167Aminotran_5/PF00266_19/5_5e10Aminotran_1_2/PF00155_21/5e09Beta_elim_lyase/PF01212_21/6_8e06OKR_DC_1/PF01276_20/0_00018Cys_Met_Meta_PP/PF01053_20/0_0017LDcluster4/PF18306_1/0_49LDcluster4/PF18306_1/6_4e03_NODE_475_length_8096_cov_496_560966_g384_i035795018